MPSPLDSSILATGFQPLDVVGVMNNAYTLAQKRAEIDKQRQDQQRQAALYKLLENINPSAPGGAQQALRQLIPRLPVESAVSALQTLSNNETTQSQRAQQRANDAFGVTGANLIQKYPKGPEEGWTQDWEDNMTVLRNMNDPFINSQLDEAKTRYTTPHQQWNVANYYKGISHAGQNVTNIDLRRLVEEGRNIRFEKGQEGSLQRAWISQEGQTGREQMREEAAAARQEKGQEGSLQRAWISQEGQTEREQMREMATAARQQEQIKAAAEREQTRETAAATRQQEQIKAAAGREQARETAAATRQQEQIEAAAGREQARETAAATRQQEQIKALAGREQTRETAAAIRQQEQIKAAAGREQMRETAAATRQQERVKLQNQKGSFSTDGLEVAKNAVLNGVPLNQVTRNGVQSAQVMNAIGEDQLVKDDPEYLKNSFLRYHAERAGAATAGRQEKNIEASAKRLEKAVGELMRVARTWPGGSFPWANYLENMEAHTFESKPEYSRFALALRTVIQDYAGLMGRNNNVMTVYAQQEASKLIRASSSFESLMATLLQTVREDKLAIMGSQEAITGMKMVPRDQIIPDEIVKEIPPEMLNQPWVKEAMAPFQQESPATPTPSPLGFTPLEGNPGVFYRRR